MREFIAYAKKLAVFVIGAVGILISEGALPGTWQPWVNSAVLLATGAGIYQVENEPLGSSEA